MCSRSGRADLVVRLWMCVSISWTSNRTRDKGVERSTCVSLMLFVFVTKVFANEAALKSGSRNVS